MPGTRTQTRRGAVAAADEERREIVAELDEEARRTERLLSRFEALATGHEGAGAARQRAELAERLLDTGARIAARHPDLRGRMSELRALLDWEAIKGRMAHELAGGPRRTVTAAEVRGARQVQIAGEAIAAIWREEVLEPREVALALGAKASNREKVSVLRRRSWLLGLPRDRGFLYPAFQVDAARRALRPEVREVNETLDAAGDPWGVASWWVSQNARLGTRPVELVGTARAEELVQAARAVTAPSG
jgi:hypothetical protein